MQQSTISEPPYHYIRLVFAPRDPEAPPVDQATLHILLTKAMTEMYGRVGAGAISALGDGVDVLDISPHSVTSASGADENSRQVLLKVARSAVTELLATLPMSSASEQHSIEIIGNSPSMPLAKAARAAEDKPGSLAWIQSFEKA